MLRQLSSVESLTGRGYFSTPRPVRVLGVIHQDEPCAPVVATHHRPGGWPTNAKDKAESRTLPRRDGSASASCHDLMSIDCSRPRVPGSWCSGSGSHDIVGPMLLPDPVPLRQRRHDHDDWAATSCRRCCPELELCDIADPALLFGLEIHDSLKLDMRPPGALRIPASHGTAPRKSLDLLGLPRVDR